MSPTSQRSLLAFTVLLAGACGPDGRSPAEPTAVRPLADAPVAAYGAVLNVSTEDDLYATVNNPANQGAMVVLAPKVYMLDPTRPNGGRIELQQDMSLQGETGNAVSVVIDASLLPVANYVTTTFPTGAVRVGRGANAIRWLTIRNAVNGAAGIETDLPSVLPSRVTISHVIAHGNRRGIDVRNAGSASAGRVLLADISYSELRNNVANVGQGLRIVNSDTATGAVIRVTLRGNNVHDNRIGCFVGNNNTSNGTISVESNGDSFDANGIGCGVAAAVSGGVFFSRFNVVSFRATGTTFRNNVGALPPAASPPAGFAVEGGSSVTAGHTSFNTASAILTNPVFSNNQGADVRVWGARTTAATPAGTNNVASVVLAGVPPSVTVEKWASVPVPAGTNVASVVRY